MYYLSTVNITTMSDQYWLLFPFKWFFRKYWHNVPLYIELQWYSYFFIFQIKISSIIFSHKFRICAFLYFMSQLFETVKESHKFRFLISINRTILNFLFVVHQVIINTCQCLSTIKVQLHSSCIFPKTINLSSHCQQVSTRIGAHFKINLFPCYFLAKPNNSVHPITLQKYELYLGVDRI